MRLEALLFAVCVLGCTSPYPVFIGSSGFVVPPSVKREPLSAGGAKVQVVQTAPQCTFIGLATGVGGIKDQYEPNDDARRAKFADEAMIALRNTVAEHGGTHVIVDGREDYANSRLESEYVLLRGRAFRC
jgi:hypothetical protein